MWNFVVNMVGFLDSLFASEWLKTVGSISFGALITGLVTWRIWFRDRKVERRRDAADIAKMLYNSIENKSSLSEEEAKDVVDRYWVLYKIVKDKFKHEKI